MNDGVISPLIWALLALEVVTLIVVLVLWLRSSAGSTNAQDPRLEALFTQLLQAELPRTLAELNAQVRATNDALRFELAQLRKDNAEAAAALRREVLDSISVLGKTLQTSLADFRGDNSTAAERLRTNVEGQLTAMTQRMNAFATDTAQRALTASDALHEKLQALGRDNAAQQEKLREAVERRLDVLNTTNAAKLEEMRQTVDEKLQQTLHTRLTESFGQVTEQLGRVHTGLGEMSALAAGVGDLKKVLSNVKSRGIVGEFFLGQQLEQMFAPDQYVANARIKANSLEAVEYALKVPNGPDSTLLLAIDSKFPIGDWERLEEAYESGTDDDRQRAGSNFERAIRAQAKLISDKYIDPETTLPFAIMYLPTAGLYAEVMRRPGLHAEIQSQYKVVIAGPSDFTMILTSFQMVFRTLKFQKNLNEIWKIFQVAQSEFEKFGGLMEKVEKQVGTVQNTLKEIGGKTKTVNRAFRNASRLELGASLTKDDTATLAQPQQHGFNGLLPTLLADEDEAGE
jgi:DNA recombination protein RmuC